MHHMIEIAHSFYTRQVKAVELRQSSCVIAIIPEQSVKYTLQSFSREIKTESRKLSSKGSACEMRKNINVQQIFHEGRLSLE